MTEQTTTYTIVHNDKPNSYEFGPAKCRHKIYYDTVEELKAQVESLRVAGFIEV
jgi:hypothetical protein